MSRPAVDVRRAGSEDVEDLLLLWSQAREESGVTTKAVIGGTPEQLRNRLHGAVQDPDVHLLLARWDGRPAGYAVVRLGPLMPVIDDPSVHVENLYVMPDLRRHGVAKALLAKVTSIAERNAADQVVISAPTNSREAQRFLARLGFTPLVVRRIAATSALRRRLAGEARRGGLEDLLSRRRSLRARSGGGPAEGPVAGSASATTGPAAAPAPREGAVGRLRTQAIRSRRAAADDIVGTPSEPPAKQRVQDTLELPAILD